MKEVLSFIIENRASLAALGSAIFGVIIRKVEKKKIEKKYEDLINRRNGTPK